MLGRTWARRVALITALSAAVVIGSLLAGDALAVPPKARIVVSPSRVNPTAAGLIRSGRVSKLPTWRNLYDWLAAPPHGSFGWSPIMSATDASGAYTLTRDGDAPGLWIWPSGGHAYTPGAAEWRYAAPGPTRVKQVAVQLSYPPRLLSHHCIAVVLRDSAHVERSERRFCNPVQPPRGNPTTVVIALSDPDGTDPRSAELAIRLELPCANPRHPASCRKTIPPATAVKDGLRVGKVDMALTDTDPPVVSPAGDWYDLRDRYVGGDGTHPVTMAADDVGSGVQRVAFEEVDRTEIAASGAPCDPAHHTAALDDRICPETYNIEADVDAKQLSEGRHDFRETARDLAGNVGTSAPWTVTVDRSAPSSPHDFLADFDEDTGEGDIDWASEDPVLADGTPGSGITSYEYRYRRQGGDWTDLVTSTESGFRFPGAAVGELVDVEVTAIDQVGNRSATASASVAVGSVGDCQGDPLAVDPIDASVHVADSGAAVDAFTFDTPKSAAEVRQMLPAGAKVVSLLERNPGTQVDSQTSAITFIPDMGWDETVAFWRTQLDDDTNDFEDYLLSARASANDEDRAVIDQQLESLHERRQSFEQYGGVPIRSFAIEHDPEAAQQITSTYGAELQKVRTSAVAGEHSEGCPAVTQTGARALRASTPSRLTAAVTSGDGASGPAETDVRPHSYSPFHVRVATYLDSWRKPDNSDDVRHFHKVVAAWRFGASSNRYYWWRGYRRNDIRRGVEVQVDLDRDHKGLSFGAPPWGFLPANNDGKTQEHIPDVWTASYGCAYPDDYLFDDIYHAYSLTVGMGCRPRSNRFRYRWAHLVTALDDHDGVQVSVQPVHYAQSSHKVPGDTEAGYCDHQHHKLGSCFFGDHGVAETHYTHTTDGRTVLTTPGQALFERQ